MRCGGTGWGYRPAGGAAGRGSYSRRSTINGPPPLNCRVISVSRPASSTVGGVNGCLGATGDEAWDGEFGCSAMCMVWSGKSGRINRGNSGGGAAGPFRGTIIVAPPEVVKHFFVVARNCNPFSCTILRPRQREKRRQVCGFVQGIASQSHVVCGEARDAGEEGQEGARGNRVRREPG